MNIILNEIESISYCEKLQGGTGSDWTRKKAYAHMRVSDFIKAGAISEELVDKLSEKISGEQQNYTQEEWDLFHEKLAEENEANFHADIIKYVNDEPNDLTPGTIGMSKANIAKDLVAQNPGLVNPDRKSELMEAINVVYESDHAVVIKLSDQDMALAKKAMTHKEDLPQA